MPLMLKRPYPLGINPEDDPDAVPIGPDPSQIPARQTATLAPDAMGAKTPITASPVATTPKTPIGNPKMEADQAELSRLQKSGSGIDQLTHPVDAQGNPDATKHPGFFKKLGAVAARVGDIAGTALFPSVTAQIPGTQLHHDILVNQAQGNISNDLENEKQQKTIDAMDAPKPKEEKWSVTPHYTGPNGEPVLVEENSGQMKVQGADGAGIKLKTPEPKTDNVQEGYAAAIADAIKNHRDPMTDPHVMAWKTAADNIAKQQKPDTPEQQFIDEEIKSGKAKTVSEAIRHYAQVTQKPEREPKQLGVAPDGTVIELRPGSKIAPGTKTVSGELAGSKPSADEQRRADLSNNLNENLDQLEDILKRRPELFGPIGGRTTAFKQLIGTDDPDIGALENLQHQIGITKISSHGMRSAQGIESAADSLLNSFKNGPNAVRAAVKSTRDSVQTFINDADKGGAKSTGGDGWAPPADAPPAPKEDGHKLRSGSQVIAVSKGGKWAKP